MTHMSTTTAAVGPDAQQPGPQGEADQLASRTGTAIAYVWPWLASQAAGGYLSYRRILERSHCRRSRRPPLAYRREPPRSLPPPSSSSWGVLPASRSRMRGN